MREIWSLTRRELAGFFHSSIAYIFIGLFLAVCLFVVFWVDTFFARNLANVRPLFQWMPLLLIFLVSAVTMRMWSEERRAGTLETLLTTPVPISKLIIGKFLACFILVVIALVLTLGLPITVSFMGPLDWGPVIGGYVAALLLATTYIAIGLFVSARTENQIVSLIISVLVCLAFYLPGSRMVEAFFSGSVAHVLSLIGTGSRFDSITRGVLDLRDLYYYASLTVAFLVLNGMALVRLRWGGAAPKRQKRHALAIWVAALMIVNVLLANFWLAPLTGARIDLTQDKIYTLSPATRDELASLSEPLLIEDIFSQKTQPLLAPLVPHLKNLMREYGIAGGHHVDVRFIAPQQSAGEVHKLASRYDIRPVPFRSQSRYEASVVNAYFDVLVKYGNQYQVLNFRKLIKVQQNPNGQLKVNLQAPEYALTSTIQQVVGEYQKKGDVFASLRSPVTLHGYISADSSLPKPLVSLRASLKTQLADLQKQAGGKLNVDIQDPQANGGKLAASIAKRYGFEPMVAGLVDTQPFYFYLLLQRGEQTVPVALPSDLSADSLKNAIVTGLDQFASGMRKTVAVFAPQPTNPRMARYGIHQGPQYTELLSALRNHVVVKSTDLDQGHVPDGTQLLLVLAPNQISHKQLFAIDQFLMTGGRVVIAASPYQVNIGPQGLNLAPHQTGIKNWLAQKGIDIGSSLVMDSHDATFPVPAVREVGGLMPHDYYAMPYPYFPYVSGKGLNDDSPVTRSLGQVTLSWASPITLNNKKLGDDTVTHLLTSSPASWLSTNTDVMPQISPSGQLQPYTPQENEAPRLLAVAVSGQFNSWFADHPNPMLPAAPKTGSPGKSDNNSKAAEPPSSNDSTPVITSVIKHSPAASRLVVISSPSFVSDGTLSMISAGLGRTYSQPIKLVQNLVDWSLESPAMLNLRDKTSVSRLLEPLSHGQQQFWEYLNYGIALLGLIVTALIAWALRIRRRARLRGWLTEKEA